MYYTPYGEKVTGSITGPDIFHKKFTGQDDDGTGLMFYKARYYDPALGRFISADSVIPGADKTQAFNRYMYVMGNPVRYYDPSGNYSEDGPGAPGHGESQGPCAAPEANHQPAPDGDHGGGNNETDTGLWRLLNNIYSTFFSSTKIPVNMYASNTLYVKRIAKDNIVLEPIIVIASRINSPLEQCERGSDGFNSTSSASGGNSNNKGYFDRFVDGVQQWGQDVTSGPRAVGGYLGNHRAAGFAACVGGALFGVSYTFAAEYVVAAKTFQVLDLTTGVLNGVIPGSPPPWLNSLPLAIGWTLANFRDPIEAYISDIWSELKKVRMEINR